MSAPKANAGRFKRHSTRHRGVSYRMRGDGTRQYAVYCKGRYIAVEGGEREALARQAELRGKTARGERIVVSSKANFAVVAEQWFESKHRLRAWTKTNYRDALDRILIARLGSMKLVSITPDHVTSLIRELEDQGLSAKTIENYLLPLSGTMKFAVRRGLIAVDPCSLLTRDERPQRGKHQEAHIWSDAEVAALIEASEYLARQPKSRYDYSPLLRTALCTGLRQGELLGLRWKDVDLHEGVLYVRRQWTRAGEYGPPKTPAGVRRLPLSDEMVKFLAALKLRSSYSSDEDPLFASRNGKPLGHRNVSGRGFKPAIDLVAIEDVTFHDMRHAFASRMIARGIEAVTLSKLMGHEDIRETLNTYAHLWDRVRTDDRVRQAMASSD